MSLSPRTYRIIVLLFTLLGLVFLALHQRSARQEKSQNLKEKESQARKAKVVSPLTLSTPSMLSSETAPYNPLRTGGKGKVRLRPGETAVLSYWEIEPGLNGMWLVTPDKHPDGNVRLSSRMLKITDQAVEKASAQDLLPDIFNPVYSGAVEPWRLGVFLDDVQSIEGADLTHWPTVLMKPGVRGSLRSIVRQPDDPPDSWIGYVLNIQADPLADGGHDLELEFDKRDEAP